MKKYNKPIVELENVDMVSIMLASKPLNKGDTGDFDNSNQESFGNIFGDLFK